MIFKFNHLVYEVPDDQNIMIVVTDSTEEVGGETHAHIDFDFWKDGDAIPMLGGWDEYGKAVKSWEDYGIRRIA